MCSLDVKSVSKELKLETAEIESERERVVRVPVPRWQPKARLKHALLEQFRRGERKNQPVCTKQKERERLFL